MSPWAWPPEEWATIVAIGVIATVGVVVALLVFGDEGPPAT
ncbi:hypothetical protein [Nocardia asteroides]